MSMWKGLKEFSTYTRSQRNGIYLLLMLALLLWGFILVDDYLYTIPESDFTEFEKQVAEWKKEDSIARFKRWDIKPFVFDPNTANDSVWKALGLDERHAATLENYKSKGGKFFRFADLERMYGLDSTWLAKVKPYARFPQPPARYPASRKDRWTFHPFDPNTVAKTDLEQMGLYSWQATRIETYREKVKPFREASQLFEVYGLDSGLVLKMLPFVKVDTSALPALPEKEEPVVVEINAADSLQLIKIKGVGPYTAKNILRYRDRLGGYYHKKQLLEVYGMDEERFLKIKDQIQVDTALIRKVSINEASFRELMKNPYLDYEMVKALVNFREKARPFKRTSEVMQLEGFTPERVEQLLPYIRL